MRFFLLIALSPIWIPIFLLMMVGLGIIGALFVAGVVIYQLFDAFSKGYIE